MKKLNSMELKDIKTLREVAEQSAISYETLKARLKLKSLNLVENVDYKKLGPRMPTILGPSGIDKITKK